MAQGIKTGGRKKGTPNKLTKELRQLLKSIIDQELEELPERLDKLDDKERLEFLLKLMPYVVPKVQSIFHAMDEPLY